MTVAVLPSVSVATKVRISLWVYRQIWKVRPLLRHLGLTSLRLSWHEVDLAVRALSPAISRYNPELIVGTGVGGAVLAAILAGNLNDTPFLAIDRSVEWKSGSRKVALLDNSSTETRRRLIAGKRLLLASAEIRSGQTITLTKKWLETLEPLEVKYVCLDYNPNAGLTPDFWYLSSSDVIKKPWTILPSYRIPDDLARPG